uniref:Transmembrane channel-like protein n=1 Tax=Scleropages formosus TaxID=113540 RepID=A0A8C9QXG9_SCLFO
MKVPIISSWQSWKKSKAKAMKRFLEVVGEAMAYIAPWRRTLHQIGGHFGGGVQSYFLFLQFLVVLNFLSCLLIAGFVLTPSIVLQSSSYVNSSNIQTIPGKSECMDYSHSPQSLFVFYQYFLDLLSGTGFMEYSYLFYGFYNNTVLVIEKTLVDPLGLFFTATCFHALCACALQVDLEDERLKQHAASLTLAQIVGLYSLRAFLNLVVLGLNGGAFYAIFRATQFSQSNSGGTFLDLLVEYLPSIVITAANFVVPFLCDQIALLERHTPIPLSSRAVFLRLASLAVLLFTLWSGITCSGNLQSPYCNICDYNHKQYPCWETRVGQEMYKLAIFDFISVVAVMILVEFPRRIIVDNCSCKLTQFVGRQAFVVPQNVLGLVYAQTVVWIGALFCPLLPVVNTIKFIIIFYLRKITLFHNCRPADRTFRSSSSNFFFFLVLLLGWILASITLIYSVAEIQPSMGCGPFRSLNMMWTVVPNSLLTLSDSTKRFMYFIGSQAFSVPLFIFLCVVLCYVAALASVYGNTASLLRTQLKMASFHHMIILRYQSHAPSDPLSFLIFNITLLIFHSEKLVQQLKFYFSFFPTL